MSPYFERIRLQPGTSLRVLTWRGHPGQAEEWTADGRGVPLAGAGAYWHYHREMELTLVETGSGTRVAGDCVAGFTAPDLVLLGSYLPHYWRGMDASSGIALQFDPDSAPFRGIPEMDALGPLFAQAARGLRLTGTARTRLRKLLTKMPAAMPSMRLALLWEMMTLLCQADEAEKECLSNRDFEHIEDSAYQPQMEKAIRLIFERAPADGLCLREILSAVGMSKATFCRQFPQHTGCSFTRFVNEVRLQHARQQLMEGRGTITEIAYASGFQNMSHFNRMFRRHTGLSPSAYREQVKFACA